MKTYIFTFFSVVLFVSVNAQQHDLNYYLKVAKSNSPLIHKAENDNKIIQLDIQQVKNILYKPEINIEANVLFAPVISHNNNTNHFEWTSKGAENYTGYDLANTDGGQYQAIISLKQPLFTASKLKTYSNKAAVSRQINENSIVLSIHELEHIVSNQYILCVKSKAQREISMELLNELKNQLLIMHQLVENAIYKQADLMILQIEYQNFEYEHNIYYTEYQNNLNDLNLLCGINDTNYFEVQAVDFEIKYENQINSEFLISYHLDSIGIVSEQMINELKYKPQLNFFANTGLNAVYQPSLNRLGFSTGINFSWNIYDGEQRKIQRQKSAIMSQTLEFEKKYFINQKEMNKNKMLSQIHALNQNILMTEDQINKYNDLYNVYYKELSQGEVSVMDYKNLLKDIAAKKQQSLLLKMEKQSLINSYNYWNY